MKKDSKVTKEIMNTKCVSDSKCCQNSCGGVIYGLGFIGAAIYNISIATSFWVGVLGFLKAIIWPVFLVFKLLGL